MRKTVTALLTLGLAAAFVAPALAANLVTETFPYPDGGLQTVSGGNWILTQSSGTDIQVVSNAAVGDMLQAPDDQRLFTAQSATAKTYYCFKVTIPTPTVAVQPNYFIHLKDGGTFNLMGRVWVLPTGTGSTFTFGLSFSSCASPCSPVPWPTTLAFDTEYTVVVNYDAAAGSSEMWVNPANESSPKILSNVVSGMGATTGVLISAIGLRQSNSSGTNWKFKVDDISVGTDFESTGCGGVTPTLDGSWGRIKTIYR